MYAMEAGKFFRFAYRLPAYKGVMRAHAERMAREERDRREAQGLADREIVPVATGELSKIPELAELVAAGEGAFE